MFIPFVFFLNKIVLCKEMIGAILSNQMHHHAVASIKRVLGVWAFKLFFCCFFIKTSSFATAEGLTQFSLFFSEAGNRPSHNNHQTQSQNHQSPYTAVSPPLKKAATDPHVLLHCHRRRRTPQRKLHPLIGLNSPT
ncbi:hypothetical protein Hanom_Chr16g01447601 [Helianthus anomalus]